ncbi:MAG: hypothetical protein COW24_03595 [Candidatus Kerfeldbacteria bacterium CG15_BIG_FIL_POST_REV_8_21_14_020_45_12]|uniref:Methyltransferase type 11 domain-containing protein n=1 Tax=Candidatus Kerfeldbacteria bacterium CG15_BIG_FIL_POST_REV_8_21_14_020_45_12 TaxID=2014247 RepID=A0A2M7H3E1_9BACT|nr:MAG: hypothetical protein COW24_03595 [Candidatus Kerfeldbacteria bacterium CG15_BIG_FIL_POST_REV_8_21_14_020_45_12]PJA93753.1 MAG: hypothetical protein CO132_01790 [Candidatus Kerfeldbacteria bacterium CG_4_9_14_3_um_filter_45_8]
MMKLIKNGWRRVGNRFGSSNKYFLQSPAGMLQRQAVSAALKTYAKGVLLDIGAGRQVYRSFLPETVTYRSLDFADTEENYEKNRALDIIGDAQNIPLDDESIDTVLCTEVLEHLPEPQLAAKEIIRLLKPGGYAIVTVPFLGYYHDEPWDYYRFTKHGLQQMLVTESTELISEAGLGGLFVYLGYIRSTIYLGLAVYIPGLFQFAFYTNIILSKLDILLDKLTGTTSLMPVTNIIVVRKR